MKRILSLAGIGVLFCLMIAGVDYRFSTPADEPEKKNCLGYTIIEAGKGINCNGDTIKLVRKHGFVDSEAH